MLFHHRKLLSNSIDESISKSCHPYCIDLTENKDGSCPILCMSQCYQICNRPLFYDLPPPSPPTTSVADHRSKSFGLSVFLSISLAILATTFFVFFSYTVYKFCSGWYSSRREQQPPAQPEEEEARLDFLDEDHGPVVDHPIWYIRTVGLQPSVISAITICKYKRSDGLVEGTDCSVCLNEFQEDETLRLLPKCNHAFHIPCIDTWLRSHTNCPMCRAGIVINPTSLQSSGQRNSDSGRVEETQERVLENIRESGRETQNEELQERVSVEVEDEQELQAQNVVIKTDEEDVAGNIFASQGDGIQPIRRSVSVDSLSALMISSAITNAFPVNSDKQVLQMNGTSTAMALKRVVTDQDLLKSAGSSSVERSLQKGSSSSSSMRSLSCSAKVFLSRYSKSSKGSVPLPRSF